MHTPRRALSMIELISAVALTSLVVGGVSLVLSSSLQAQIGATEQAVATGTLERSLNTIKPQGNLKLIGTLVSSAPEARNYTHGSDQFTLIYIDESRATEVNGSAVQTNPLHHDEQMGLIISGSSAQLLPRAGQGTTLNRTGAIALSGSSCRSPRFYPAQTVTVRFDRATNSLRMERNFSGVSGQLSSGVSGMRSVITTAGLNVATQTLSSEGRGQTGGRLLSYEPIDSGTCSLGNPASVSGSQGETWVHMSAQGLPSTVNAAAQLSGTLNQLLNFPRSTYVSSPNGTLRVIPQVVRDGESNFGTGYSREFTVTASSTTGANPAAGLNINGTPQYLSLNYVTTGGRVSVSGARGVELTGPGGTFTESKNISVATGASAAAAPGFYLSEIDSAMQIQGSSVLVPTDLNMPSSSLMSTGVIGVSSGANQAISSTFTAVPLRNYTDSSGFVWGERSPSGMVRSVTNCQGRTSTFIAPGLSSSRQVQQYYQDGTPAGTVTVTVRTQVTGEEIGCATLNVPEWSFPADLGRKMTTAPEASACQGRGGNTAPYQSARRTTGGVVTRGGVKVVATPAPSSAQSGSFVSLSQVPQADEQLYQEDCIWQERSRREIVPSVPALPNPNPTTTTGTTTGTTTDTSSGDTSTTPTSTTDTTTVSPTNSDSTTPKNSDSTPTPPKDPTGDATGSSTTDDGGSADCTAQGSGNDTSIVYASKSCLGILKVRPGFTLSPLSMP